MLNNFQVHRVRNKWKCTFKDAILNINGKEYIFDKVTGELERDWQNNTNQ